MIRHLADQKMPAQSVKQLAQYREEVQNDERSVATSAK